MMSACLHETSKQERKSWAAICMHADSLIILLQGYLLLPASATLSYSNEYVCGSNMLPVTDDVENLVSIFHINNKHG